MRNDIGFIITFIFQIYEVISAVNTKSTATKERANLPNFFFKYGQYGKNYLIDENNHPYILCEYYNTEECLNGQTKDQCAYVKKCYGETRAHELRCMTAFVLNNSITSLSISNTNGRTLDIAHTKAIRQDCWSQLSTELADCETEDQCVAEHRSTLNSGNTAFFCCCKTHQCNKNITYKSHFSAAEPKSEVHVWTNNNETILWTSLTVLLFIGVCVAFAFLAYVLRKKMQMTNLKKVDSNVHNLRKVGNRNEEQLKKGIKSTNKTEKNEENQTMADEYVALIDGKSVNLYDFNIIQLISMGRFGKVYKANVNGVIVAAKMFPVSDVDSWICEQDLYSVQALRSHPNISSFVAAFPRDNCFWLLTRFCENGSLYDYLKNHKLSLRELSTIAYTMLNGLAFLHEETRLPFFSKPTIVHRDLKSKNILIKDDLTACIADFGLAIKCEARRIAPDSTQGQVGTRRYMSPELLEGAMEFSSFAFQQADVYAASLVLWEVLSRTVLLTEKKEAVAIYNLPFDVEIGHPPSLGEIRDLVVIQKYRPKLRDSLYKNEFTNAIAKTMVEMWEKEPDARITSGCARDRIFHINKAIIRYYNLSENKAFADTPICESNLL